MPSFRDLESLYAEPQRHYHTARHIVDCLRQFDQLVEAPADPLSLELALWFHDAIYDPKAPDNEERSAELSRTVITRAGGSDILASRVQSLVLATKSHLPYAAVDVPWMIDVDLSILGRSADDFAAYESAIRAEYLWVDESVYRARRTEFLEGFLARTRIFTTDRVYSIFEDAARRNLQGSIDRLRTPGH